MNNPSSSLELFAHALLLSEREGVATPGVTKARAPRIGAEMLFGKTEGFAIEAEVLEAYGKWTYGHLRFWIGGVSIGDFDDTSDAQE